MWRGTLTYNFPIGLIKMSKNSVIREVGQRSSEQDLQGKDRINLSSKSAVTGTMSSYKVHLTLAQTFGATATIFSMLDIRLSFTGLLKIRASQK